MKRFLQLTIFRAKKKKTCVFRVVGTNYYRKEFFLVDDPITPNPKYIKRTGKFPGVKTKKRQFKSIVKGFWKG